MQKISEGSTERRTSDKSAPTRANSVRDMLNFSSNRAKCSRGKKNFILANIKNVRGGHQRQATSFFPEMKEEKNDPLNQTQLLSQPESNQKVVP